MILRGWLSRRRRRWPGGARKVQVLRRTLQLLVLALLFAIPTLSLYDNLRNQRDEVGIQSRWDTRLVHRLVADLEEPKALTQAVRGSVWTFKAGELVISDPLAVVDFVAASRVPWDRFLITALLPVLLSLLLGRVFCGWLCPADLLFELAGKARNWAGIKTDVTFSRGTKTAVLAAGVVAAVILGNQVFAEIYPPRIVGAELYLWITFGTFGAGAWFFLALIAFEIFVSRRFWCRYVCPGGALYALLGRYRLLRLEVDPVACTECRLCNVSCELGLDPMGGRFGQDCNNCGLCVRACGHDALNWRLGLPPSGGVDRLGHPESGVAAATPGEPAP
ncbi:MAG: 4Fe-4S binding protein [bacterium]|nr:4Fe-4S binding protein [bacterium]